MSGVDEVRRVRRVGGLWRGGRLAREIGSGSEIQEETLASHASALKAHRQNIVQRDRNRQMRTRLRGALRDIRTAIDAGDPAQVKDALRNTISLVDKMAAKKVIHRNAAARYKSRLSARVTKRSPAL